MGSKIPNSKKKPLNNPSTSRAMGTKRKLGRIYPQENLKSSRTIQNKRIPGILPRSTPGGQAACKHPKESQVGIQNTRSFNEQNNKTASNTPITIGVDKPKRKLFNKNINQNPTIDNMVPIDTDLEILLINSCKINALKVQDIVEHFIKSKAYTVLFCMTETKVDSLDFSPRGITLFSAHRNRKEKRGGGLTIRYANKADITLKEINTKSNDILAVEGTVLRKKFRMILCYFDSSKSTTDSFYKKNRVIQKEVEKLMEVDADTELVCLGDMNGRLKRLEPSIKSDENGKMVEGWVRG